MKINKNITTINRNIRSSRSIDYIVIHYVGAVSSAKNNTIYFKSVNRNASAHYFIDEKEIWQCVEDKDVAWHCGAKKYYHNKCRNNNSIGIEMCVKNNGKWYFEDDTVKNTIALTKNLMKKYNIPITNVIRHYDVTHKNCPEPYVRDISKWNSFKERLIDKNIEVYNLITDIPVYTNSSNAKNKIGSVGTYQKGSYYVFNKSLGMINITKTVDKPGGWINPDDNAINESTEDNEKTIKEDNIIDNLAPEIKIEQSTVQITVKKNKLIAFLNKIVEFIKNLVK